MALFHRYHLSIKFLPLCSYQTRKLCILSRKTPYYHGNSMQFPCLYYISRISTAFFAKLIPFSAKTNNILLLFTLPLYTIRETPDFCVKVYFCLRVPKFLWHYFWIAACAAVKYFLSLPAQGSAPPHSNLLTIPAIVKKWCKIRKRSCSLNRKKAQKAKKQNRRTREMPYFQAFLRFPIVSISLLRCFLVPVDIFLIEF